MKKKKQWEVSFVQAREQWEMRLRLETGWGWLEKCP
jgi:hypothetical protein